MNAAKLHGMIPAIVLPMTDEYQPDISAIPPYVEWLLGQGPVGLAVNVDTGEGPHLTRDERRSVLQVVRGATEGRAAIVAGIGGPSTAAACAEAAAAAEAGADALVVFPIPAFLASPLRPDVATEYHKAVAEASGLPLILFQLQPALGGVIYPEPVLEELLALDGVIGLKEASFDPVRFLRARSQVRATGGRVALLNGNDNFIAEAIALGADGALLGFGSLMLREQVEMLIAARTGETELLPTGGPQIQVLADVIFAPPISDYRARIKEALVALGVIERAVVRPPLLPIPEPDRQRILGTLRSLGVLEPSA